MIIVEFTITLSHVGGFYEGRSHLTLIHACLESGVKFVSGRLAKLDTNTY